MGLKVIFICLGISYLLNNRPIYYYQVCAAERIIAPRAEKIKYLTCVRACVWRNADIFQRAWCVYSVSSHSIVRAVRERDLSERLLKKAAHTNKCCQLGAFYAFLKRWQVKSAGAHRAHSNFLIHLRKKFKAV
jgi:hypothetical protein